MESKIRVEIVGEKTKRHKKQHNTQPINLKARKPEKTDGDNENLINRRCIREYIAIKTCNSKQCNIIAMNKMSEKNNEHTKRIINNISTNK